MPETGLHVRTSLSKCSGIRIKDLFEENIEKLTIFDSPPFLPQHHQIQICVNTSYSIFMKRKNRRVQSFQVVKSLKQIFH